MAYFTSQIYSVSFDVKHFKQGKCQLCQDKITKYFNYDVLTWMCCEVYQAQNSKFIGRLERK